MGMSGPSSGEGGAGEEEKKEEKEEVAVFVVSAAAGAGEAAGAVVVGKGCVCARVSARPARGDEAAARRMMRSYRLSRRRLLGARRRRILPGRYHLFLPGAGGAVHAASRGLLDGRGAGAGVAGPGLPGVTTSCSCQAGPWPDRYRRIYTAALSGTGTRGQQRFDTRPPGASPWVLLSSFAPHAACAPVCVCVCVCQ